MWQMTVQEALLEAREKAASNAGLPNRKPATACQGMWKHAYLMALEQPDHPSSLQAIHMCRRMLYEEDRLAAQRDHHKPYLTPSDRELAQDSAMMSDGFQGAMLKYRDPATAMQHLLYCMMQELVVPTLPLHID